MVRRHLKRARQRYKHLPQSKRDSCWETLIHTAAEFVIGVLSTFLLVLPGLYALEEIEDFWSRFDDWFNPNVSNFGLSGALASIVITLYFTITVCIRAWLIRRWFVKHEDHIK